VFGFSMLLINVPSGAAIFATMFFICGGMFFVHATAMGTMNKLASEHRAIANGLYISIYYAGAALGSWLPGLIYQEFGWGAFTVTLTAAIVGAVIITRGLKIPAENSEKRKRPAGIRLAFSISGQGRVIFQTLRSEINPFLATLAQKDNKHRNHSCLRNRSCRVRESPSSSCKHAACP
jgi:MFS family permease